MNHPIHRVISFEILSPYKLRIHFEDLTEQNIDFEPVLAGELYGPLHDLELFNQVQIDSDAHTLVWPNGADFDPATAGRVAPSGEAQFCAHRLVSDQVSSAFPANGDGGEGHCFVSV